MKPVGLSSGPFGSILVAVWKCRRASLCREQRSLGSLSRSGVVLPWWATIATLASQHDGDARANSAKEKQDAAKEGAARQFGGVRTRVRRS